MTSTQDDIQRIVEEIRVKSRHTYLEKYLQYREVPVFFVQVLYCVLRSHQLDRERTHPYCVSATLLEMGLSIHETVTTEDMASTQGLRTRQLSVLAGDYFSSLFYRELARADEVGGIVPLAQAICTINEAKMERYELENGSDFSWIRWVELSKVIYGGLIQELSSFFCPQETARNPWFSLVGNLMLLSYIKKHGKPVPRGIVEVLSAETVYSLKEFRPREARHELLQILQEHDLFHTESQLVKESS